MKLIIEIDEDDYSLCKMANEATSVRKTIGDNLRYAIANGTPLDDIKLEIFEHAYPVCYDRNSIEKGMTLTGIMQVFDKHISGKEQ